MFQYEYRYIVEENNYLIGVMRDETALKPNATLLKLTLLRFIPI